MHKRIGIHKNRLSPHNSNYVIAAFGEAQNARDKPNRKTASYVMTSESVAAYIQHEIDRGASKDSIRNFKRVTNSLFEWLPEDKTITKTGCRNGGRL